MPAYNTSRPWGWGIGSKGQKTTFSEHGHAAYQIKRNHECRIMVANIYPADHIPPTPTPPPPPTPDPWVRSKFKIFRAWPCCISNLKESRMQQHGSKYFARKFSPRPQHIAGIELYYD